MPKNTGLNLRYIWHRQDIANNLWEYKTTCCSVQCFWQIPSAVTQTNAENPKLDATNGKIVYQVPNVPTNKAGYVWKGGVVPRTHCTGSGETLKCSTGDCTTNPDGSCLLGQSPGPPSTQAEFTLVYKSVDAYDVETINGLNVPVSMGPTTYKPSAKADSYQCGFAGKINSGEVSVAPTQCTWSFAMMNSTIEDPKWSAHTATYRALHYVVPNTPTDQHPKPNETGGTCSISAPDKPKNAQQSCTNNTEVCGLSSYNASHPVGEIHYTCGKLIGFWSTNQLCSYTAAPVSKMKELACNDTMTTGLTKLNWLGCDPKGTLAHTSCYGGKKEIDKNQGYCCGCPYWGAANTGGQFATPPAYLTALFSDSKHGISVPSPNSGGGRCDGDYKDWIKKILLPDLAWMKRGCPSTYIYAYDDVTSSFYCSSQSKEQPMNDVSYDITFCPGNINGEINKIELNTSFKRPDNMSAWSQSERNVTLKEAGKKRKEQ